MRSLKMALARYGVKHIVILMIVIAVHNKNSSMKRLSCCNADHGHCPFPSKILTNAAPRTIEENVQSYISLNNTLMNC